MKNRTFACIVAAGFLGVTLTAGATQALAGGRDVVVQGQRVEPEHQRTVSYADLNLARSDDQKALKGRIYSTAKSLCYDLNGLTDGGCTFAAVRSTDDQVAQAIDRAQRQMAGLEVRPDFAISMMIGIRQ